MAPRPPSAVTRWIYVGTFAAIAVVASLSVAIYRSAVREATTQNAAQQLATVRTAAAAIHGEVESLSARLRQFNSMPSVQNIDTNFLGQRIAAAFADNPGKLIRFVVRVDSRGMLYAWLPNGTLVLSSSIDKSAPEIWDWGADRNHANQVRMISNWRDPAPADRTLMLPVWRDSPSGEHPQPTREFNGFVALVIDVNQFVDRYLAPARSDAGREDMSVGLSTPSAAIRLGRDGLTVTPMKAEPHADVTPYGTEISAAGSRLGIHAWAKLQAADETWMVAAATDYAVEVAQLERSAAAQLALSTLLLIAVPLAGWLVLRRDRQQQNEQRILERRLADSQRMEAIGKVAGGVAHDFNNVLTAILGYASMIQEDAPPRSAIRDQAQQIRRAAESAAALTQKLLTFSRKHVLQPNVVDLRSMLGNLLTLVRKAVGEDVQVSTQIGEDLWPVLADPIHIEQSIVNLAINAREAMPNGGSLQITARNAPRAGGERRPDIDVQPGDYVQITVTDTGVGMDEATRTRMFEPFFTTKAPGHGSGLGLSTVYGFVRQCGGYISVLSTPGKGTSIEVLLPRAETPAANAMLTPPSMVQGPGAAGKETVLIAEDEEGVRLLATESLERRGFHVLAADSGEAALKLASAYDGTIHVLLTDVIMPGMKGPELADRMRALRPGIRVLLMSGYSAEIVTPGDLEQATLITKPFSPAALSKAVRATLDARLPSETA